MPLVWTTSLSIIGQSRSTCGVPLHRKRTCFFHAVNLLLVQVDDPDREFFRLQFLRHSDGRQHHQPDDERSVKIANGQFTLPILEIQIEQIPH